MSLQDQHRHFTQRHERHLLNQPSPSLAQGREQFSLYSQPSLLASQYDIAVQQIITAVRSPEEEKADAVTRKSKFIPTEWALTSAPNTNNDSAVLLSVFPAPGETAPSFRTLPHIVLRDAELPWARTVSEKVLDSHANEITWLALLVFTAEELSLDEEHHGAYFKSSNASINDTFGWNIAGGDVEKIRDPRLANFIPAPSQSAVYAGSKTSVIAVPATLFTKMFTNERSTEQFDASPYRFMSHVRTVATSDTLSVTMANNTDSSDPAEMGTANSSVVISSRLGPTAINVPTPVFAHLISLQDVDTKPVEDLGTVEHVLMTSLYSWTYTALPPGAPDVASILQSLGNKDRGLSILRTDQMRGSPDPITMDKDPIAELVKRRQKDGYTLVRHHTIAGEETTAMLRGPFSTTVVPHPLNAAMPFQSNFGTDLQIFDPALGLMDITYASAWQLGKKLALADSAFTIALSKLRQTIHHDAIEAGRVDDLQKVRDISKEPSTASLHSMTSVPSSSSGISESRVKHDVNETIDALKNIEVDVDATRTFSTASRWNPKHRVVTHGSDITITTPRPEIFLQELYQHSGISSPIHAGAASGDDGGGPYKYHTVPINTDFALIQGWVFDKMHLSSVPAHYLIPDQSHLPSETLRFFYVDANWIDALIDGALSLANHFAEKPADDFFRTALKDILNRHFTTSTVGGYCQQMPAYGFILRSQLVVQFPDLAISAEFEDQSHTQNDAANRKPKAPILVQRQLAPDVTLVLFDRAPPNLSRINISLPAHQQTFAAASSFSTTTDEVEMHYKPICATGAAAAPLDVSDQTQRRESLHVPACKFSRSKIFDWETRTLKIWEYTNLVHDNLLEHMPEGQYTAGEPTAAVFALQLAEPSYTLAVPLQLS